MAEVDVTTQIKRIESLKCALLTDLAALYEAMRVPGGRGGESLAALTAHAYMLAGRLGLAPGDLDAEVTRVLKREAAHPANAAEARALLTHILRDDMKGQNAE